eukprot:1204702-Amorphochlora_amoeboformis.AAC.1
MTPLALHSLDLFSRCPLEGTNGPRKTSKAHVVFLNLFDLDEFAAVLIHLGHEAARTKIEELLVARCDDGRNARTNAHVHLGSELVCAFVFEPEASLDTLVRVFEKRSHELAAETTFVVLEVFALEPSLV